MITKPIAPILSLKLGQYIGELLRHRSQDYVRSYFNGKPAMFLKCYGDDDGNGFNAWFLVDDKIEKIHLWTHEFCAEWEVIDT